MEIKIVIDAPTGWKRRVLLYVVTPVGIIAAAAMAAHAYDTTWIANTQPVSATSLKADLDEAQARIAALEKPVLAVYGVMGAGQVIPSGDTVINFDTKFFDSNGAVQTGSAWKFVCPLPGYYRINSVVTLGTSWSAGTRVYVYVAYDNVEMDTFNDFMTQSTVNGNLTGSGGYVIYCAATHALSVGVHSAQGATVNGSVDIELISQ